MDALPLVVVMDVRLNRRWAIRTALREGVG
jgi:hypothetical protein